jgi:hypothetical protein
MFFHIEYAIIKIFYVNIPGYVRKDAKLLNISQYSLIICAPGVSFLLKAHYFCFPIRLGIINNNILYSGSDSFSFFNFHQKKGMNPEMISNSFDFFD